MENRGQTPLEVPDELADGTGEETVHGSKVGSDGHDLLISTWRWWWNAAAYRIVRDLNWGIKSKERKYSNGCRVALGKESTVKRLFRKAVLLICMGHKLHPVDYAKVIIHVGARQPLMLRGDSVIGEYRIGQMEVTFWDEGYDR
jgi:hypothetical protein